MGLFSRWSRAPVEQDQPVPDDDDQRPLRPYADPLRSADLEVLDRCRAQLAEAGVDTTSLHSIGAAYDTAVRDWAARVSAGEGAGSDHGPMVERFAVAIGDWLVGQTDLRWAAVTDVFGTALGLMSADDEFAVVPVNMVSGRWLNGQTGWIAGVLGHLVRLRAPDR